MKSEVKIGIVGVVAIVALFLGINFLKGVNLFNSSKKYYISFSNTKGLAKSSSVYADGFKVGIVSDINYDYRHPGEVVVEISTDNGLRIPKGSSAQLDEAILGGCTLNMLLATNLTESYQPGDTIKGNDVSGLMAKAGDMMPQLQQIVEKVDTLVATLNTLLSNPNLPLIIQNAELVTENLNKSSEQLNTLLRNDIPKLTGTFTKAGENVNTLTDKMNQLDLQATLDNVNQTINSVHTMMEKMQSPKGTLGKLMNDPSVYDNLNHTVQSADSLVTDLKEHPKRYVHFSVFGKKEGK
ncbi:MAG: MCE family protein [Bacteroidaceae bacterium]|nr:MCE family protein [Bacteroidaceae bacterium]MBQ9293865.1 MCE family protein [Bacteroidaceae bacterium]